MAKKNKGSEPDPKTTQDGAASAEDVKKAAEEAAAKEKAEQEARAAEEKKAAEEAEAAAKAAEEKKAQEDAAAKAEAEKKAAEEEAAKKAAEEEAARKAEEIEMIAEDQILHDGDRVEPGESFSVKKKSQAEKLVRIGAAKVKG